ncbi:hypothetical protein [Ammonifex thiophilus]|uniref:Uncharacterized protein n=1 Tax=Ammonifex thiophilus TaxID=444093 RepID=A0A3D8P3D3_9THEO|nr:hypothetical protein [Ammonifex thiophilus]RDV81686.1 hypothetical protein DXX99_09220 [Ammonifex thiophilus]
MNADTTVAKTRHPAPLTGVYVETEQGTVRACSVSVEVAYILHDEERGKKYYAVRLGPPLDTEVLVPTGKGAAGIARAVAEAGAWVNVKLLAQHLDNWLAENWAGLPVKTRAPGESQDDDPEALSIYEQFLLWVDANVSAFDSGQWGYVEEGNPERRILVLPPVLGAFFQKVGVRTESERRAVLRCWKERGWLRVQNNNKFTVVRREHDGRLRRFYEVVEKVVEKLETGSV